MLALTVVAFVFPLFQTGQEPPHYNIWAAVVDAIFEGLFLLEFLARFATCPSLATFVFCPYNVIDLIGTVPLALRVGIGFNTVVASDLKYNIFVCFVPLARILKTLRRFEKLHLLVRAFKDAAEALPVLLFMLFLICLIFGVLIYLVEPRDNIDSLPLAMWLTLVTMTTVGYGDVYPISYKGRMIASALTIVTLLYMAIPLGIIGDALTDAWKERDRILLMQRTRHRLRQWGYTARDIPVLFRDSSNTDGMISLPDFRRLLTQMHLGFPDVRMVELFNSFDSDGSGYIDDKEFVRGLFPGAYCSLYETTSKSNDMD